MFPPTLRVTQTRWDPQPQRAPARTVAVCQIDIIGIIQCSSSSSPFMAERRGLPHPSPSPLPHPAASAALPLAGGALFFVLRQGG